MTVDLVGTVRVPISLEELVTSTRETLGRLLGINDPPEIEVFADRQYDDEGVVHPGRRLGPSELRSTMIGKHHHGARFEPSIRRRFNLETSTGDGASLMVFDHCGVEGHTGPVKPLDATFSPVRTCVGVVVTTALALTAATLGRGRFDDINIFLLEPPEEDPERVVALTRLPDTGQDFSRRCERYMRQFAGQNGWPPAVDSTS
jgi:hypothetical protein